MQLFYIYQNHTTYRGGIAFLAMEYWNSGDMSFFENGIVIMCACALILVILIVVYALRFMQSILYFFYFSKK